MSGTRVSALAACGLLGRAKTSFCASYTKVHVAAGRPLPVCALPWPAQPLSQPHGGEGLWSCCGWSKPVQHPPFWTPAWLLMEMGGLDQLFLHSAAR